MGNLFDSGIVYKNNDDYCEFNFKPKNTYAYSIDGKKKDEKLSGQDIYGTISFNVNNIEVKYFAIFDGHGKYGKRVSHQVSKQVEEFIKANKSKIAYWDSIETLSCKFIEFFKSIQINMLKSDGKSNIFEMSGTCVIIVMIINTSIYTINLGDSRAVLGSYNNNKCYTVDLSTDHKPNDYEEMDRITQYGGEVISSIKNEDIIQDKIADMIEINTFRIYKKGEFVPGLAVSRTLGDLFGHTIGVLEVPQISYKVIEPFDKFVVIGSDGLFDSMNSMEVVEFINERLNKYPKNEIAKLLVEESRNRAEIINKVKVEIFANELLELKENRSAEVNNSIKDNIEVTSNFKMISEITKSFSSSLMIDDITCIICFIN